MARSRHVPMPDLAFRVREMPVNRLGERIANALVARRLSRVVVLNVLVNRHELAPVTDLTSPRY